SEACKLKSGAVSPTSSAKAEVHSSASAPSMVATSDFTPLAPARIFVVVIANFLKSWSWRGRRAPLCETLSNQDGHKGDTPPGLFLTISPEASGNQLADDAIVLVENEYLARRPKTESQVGAAGLVFARSRVLFADQLQQGLALASIVEQDA